jgi:hypothetical protein
VSNLRVATEEEVIVKWSEEEKQLLPPRYGCEILLEDTTMENAKDTSYPNDAYIVIYTVDGKKCIDLCRGSRVRIFDLYYDKFGPGSVQNIDWGYGRISPKLWGYKAPQKKKKR